MSYGLIVVVTASKTINYVLFETMSKPDVIITEWRLNLRRAHHAIPNKLVCALPENCNY